MTAKYFALLTTVGAAKLANATALGVPLSITTMAVGDANGAEPTPDTAQTALIHECHRAPLNSLSVDSRNPSQIIAEQILTETVGGWWVREIGLFDDNGDLIAVGNCPPSYKPVMEEGAGREQIIRMILIVSSSDAVTLKIDPSVVLATRKYVDDSIETHAKSRNHPDATLKAKGFVQLSSTTDSSSEALAATPKAVKAVKDAVTDLSKAVVKSINTTHKPDAAGNVTLTADDVSAFAIRKNLTVADSPNTLHGSDMHGHYGVPGVAAATVAKGYPIDGFLGAIFVMWGPNATQQVAFHNDGRQFTRAVNGAWNGKDGPWSKWEHGDMLPVSAAITRLDDPLLIDVTRPVTLAGKYADHPLGPAYGSAGQLHTYRRYFDAGAAVYQQLVDGAGLVFCRVGEYGAQKVWKWQQAGTSGYPFGWRRVFDSGNPPTATQSGAFPFRGALGTQDLHTLTGSKYGVYWQGHDANATLANNYPVANAAGALVVYQSHGSDIESCSMEYRPWNANDLYRCHYREDTKVWSGWDREFNTGHKPTAQDTGALPLSGGTLTGIVKTNAEIQSTSQDNYRIVAGSYGTFWRNDGANLYLMLTNKDNPDGGWDDLRPLRVELVNGHVEIATELNVTTVIREQGQRVYSPNNKPPQIDAYTKSQSDGRYSLKTVTVTDARQGAVVSAGRMEDHYNAPAGCSLVGLAHNGSSDTKDLGMFYCAHQICINGNWRTIGRL